MLNIFKPSFIVESIYDIKVEDLKRFGKEVVFTDLDSTLIAWDHPHPTEELIEWIKNLDDNGIEVVVLSKNTPKRVTEALKALDITHVPSAYKPRRKRFKKAFDSVNSEKDKIIMVGDQVITDIIGANRFKIDSVLVKPILDSDAWNTNFNRLIEYKILKYIVKHDPKMKWSNSLDD